MKVIKQGIDMGKLTQIVREAIKEMFSADKSKFLIIDDESVVIYDEYENKQEYPQTMGIIGELVKRHISRILLIQNPYHDPRFNS